MSDYGIQVTQPGKSAPSDNLTDVLMTTRFPFASVDSTISNSFRTTNIAIANNPVNFSTTLMHQFAHGYTYKPKVWGLWTVSPSGSYGIVNTQSYGYYISNTTPNFWSTWYVVDETNVSLYLYYENNGGLPSIVGANIIFTSLVFVSDFQAQDYS